MTRTPRPCAHPGCATLTTSARCRRHKRTRYSPSYHAAKLPGARALRLRVLERDANTCVYCGGPATTVDHRQPVSRGGPALDPSNLVAACARCNARKGSR